MDCGLQVCWGQSYCLRRVIWPRNRKKYASILLAPVPRLRTASIAAPIAKPQKTLRRFCVSAGIRNARPNSERLRSNNRHLGASRLAIDIARLGTRDDSPARRGGSRQHDSLPFPDGFWEAGGGARWQRTLETGCHEVCRVLLCRSSVNRQIFRKRRRGYEAVKGLVIQTFLAKMFEST